MSKIFNTVLCGNQINAAVESQQKKNEYSYYCVDYTFDALETANGIEVI